MPAPPSTRLDRPAGYFPRRTSLGLVGLIGLLIGVPFVALQCAAPFIAGGLDVLLACLPYLLVFGIAAGLTFAFAIVKHRYWSVCLFFYAGWAVLLAYLLDVLFALAALGGVFTLRDPGLRVLPLVGFILLLLLGLCAWFLLRALRLRYWQPGTTPDQWEMGDETPPGWSLSPRR